MGKILIYDTTLRDGSQGENINFSKEDKIRILLKLDELGFDYVEGGWPGSNPKDMDFFKLAAKQKLKKVKVTAFGSTAHPKHKNVANDVNLKELINSKAPVICIFGKSWDLHVTTALKISLEKNLKLISDSIKFLKKHKREVIYDAEHFFDGYYANKDYAIKTLLAAQDAGADLICLCETNGGMLPVHVRSVIEEIKQYIKIPLGIHAHNDSGCAVANSIDAVLSGATMVQGTMNGFGERCGNANLCTIIPDLKFKLNYNCITSKNMKKLTSASRFVSELTNLPHNETQPYVGNSAFAHKAGIHVSAIQKDSRTYEHLAPELVGNYRRVLVSELSGRSNILYKAKNLNLNLEKDNPNVKPILDKIKTLENQGYQFEAAEASFEILVMKALNKFKKLFTVEGFRVINEKKAGQNTYCEATIKINVNGKEEHTAADGDGPVNALDKALRKALLKFYPEIKNVKLNDYKVRVLESNRGTGAIVRVLIESIDGKGNSWGTVGASENIIEASWSALLDSLNYYLLKKGKFIKSKKK